MYGAPSEAGRSNAPNGSRRGKDGRDHLGRSRSADSFVARLLTFDLIGLGEMV